MNDDYRFWWRLSVLFIGTTAIVIMWATAWCCARDICAMRRGYVQKPIPCEVQDGYKQDKVVWTKEGP